MAGSFSHLVDDDGGFSLALVENGGDRIEALIECWDIIVFLASGKPSAVNKALKAMGHPTILSRARTLRPSDVDRRADGSFRVRRKST